VWIAASLQGINRFVISGVLAATLALLVQDWVQPAGLIPGVATVTGALMAGRTLLSMVAAPLAGTASDWLGDRWRVAIWGLVFGAAGMSLIAWQAPGAVVAGLALSAVTGGSVQAIATTLTGDIASPRQRGRAIGLLHTAGDLGSAIGPPAAYALLPWAGLHGVYIFCAALFAVGLVLALGFETRSN
jgi:MFS family permease